MPLKKETHKDSLKPLEPRHDGFRNYVKGDFSVMPEELLLERANLIRTDCKRNDLFNWRYASVGS